MINRLSFVLVLMLICSGSLVASYPVEIVELRHQTVEQMIPLIKPFLGSGSSISGMHGKLIIKTAPENLANILEIIAQFDKSPKQLMIYVAQGDFRQRSGQQQRANVDVDLGDHGNLTIGNPPSTRRGVAIDATDVSINIRQQQRILDDEITQRIRATEGFPAFIKTGIELPIPVQSRQGIGRGSIISYGYSEASSGFYVLANVRGQNVTLEINPQKQQPGYGGSIHTQNLSTFVTGRIGEWIELGGSVVQGSSRNSSILSSGSQKSSRQQPIWVLVQVLSPLSLSR